MPSAFDLSTLVTVYDQGYLVPFIGSGMSMPTCASWPVFVQGLERLAGCYSEPAEQGRLIERALLALQHIRRRGMSIKDTIRSAVYPTESREVPRQTKTLASIFWPLICTTNYDDLYCRARLGNSGNNAALRVVGRSDQDCWQVSQHLRFPASEVVWSLQGFLGTEDKELSQVLQNENPNVANLADELVVGHAEYRQVAHRAPHFRRCFAQIFQSRSLLFLGSGLAEPYFRALFDEIIELTGPPSRPHFAVVPEGSVDPDFLRSQYHILCHLYAKDQHQEVTDLLDEFTRLVRENRPRPSSWSFHIASPERVGKEHARSHFTVVRAGLPAPSDLPISQDRGSINGIAISCGRAKDHENHSGPGVRGVPLPSSVGVKAIGLAKPLAYNWLNDWTVKWHGQEHCYGIAARELVDKGGSSGNRRSPEAIREAFYSFLEQMQSEGISIAHVQLLAAGKKRVFQPWVSLVQMARAYGQWARKNFRPPHEPSVRVKLYVVDPSIILLLNGGYIDLVEQLEDTPMQICLEIIAAEGNLDRQYVLAKGQDSLAKIAKEIGLQREPKIHARPIPRLKFTPQLLSTVKDQTVDEFGLVSGSTLTIDYRASSLRNVYRMTAELTLP